MSYLVLARKWRPQTFRDMVSQEHVTQTLINAIKNDKVAHAYLFTGPRGIGKTTAARILAKALNCEVGVSPTPCNKCNSCLQITDSRSPDVFEIDGASNRGIDEVRSLRERIQYHPQGRYKIFIIDEVHMLTKDAFNALLKTIEEPPSHVIFIFATTEPEKIIGTILSRCQRFDFRRIPSGQIKQKLLEIADSEGVKLTEEAALTLAHRADGSMRDALSLLDQLLAFAPDQEVNPQVIAKLLGILSFDAFCELADGILNHKANQLLQNFDILLEQGTSLTEIFNGLVEHFHNLLLFKFDSIPDQFPENMVERYKELAESVIKEDLLRILKILSSLQTDIKYSSNPRYRFEEVLIHIASLESMTTIQELLDNLGSGGGYNSNPGMAKTKIAPEVMDDDEEPPIEDEEYRVPEEHLKAEEVAIPETASDVTDQPNDAKWDNFMAIVRREKGEGFAAPLSKTKVIYDENRIVLEFPGGYEFQMEFLETKGNFDYLQNQINDIYGDKTELEFILSNEIQDEIDDDKTPDKVLDLFNEFKANPMEK